MSNTNFSMVSRQTELTLNFLRQSRLVRTISEYTYLYGPHNYNANPLVPFVCEVQMQVKPAQRDTSAPHLVAGFYIGTSQWHYICHNLWVKHTKIVSIGDTLFFKHKYITNITITNAKAIIQAAYNLASAIDNNIPKISQSKKAINNFMELFKIQANQYEEISIQHRVLDNHVPPQRVCEKPETLPAVEV